MECIDLIYKISVIILTLVTILLTYYIYRLTNENSKKENYLRYIAESYYRIEEDFSNMLCESSPESKSKNEFKNSNCKKYRRQIIINSTLMMYYVRRFPGYYKERRNFEIILYDLTRHPEKPELYDLLLTEFTKFCCGVKKKKEKDGVYPIHLNNWEKMGYAEDD